MASAATKKTQGRKGKVRVLDLEPSDLPSDDAGLAQSETPLEPLDFSEDPFEPAPDESLPDNKSSGDKRFNEYFRFRHREMTRQNGGDRARVTNLLAEKSQAGASTINNYISDTINKNTGKPTQISLNMLHRFAPAFGFESRGELLQAVDDWYLREFAVTPRSLCRRVGWADCCRRFMRIQIERGASNDQLVAMRQWLVSIAPVADGGAPNPMTVDYLESHYLVSRMDR